MGNQKVVAVVPIWDTLKVILLCLGGILVAEFVAALIFTICLSVVVPPAHFPGRIIFSAVVGVPVAIYLTYGKVTLMVLCGEVLKRRTIFYPLAGAAVGYWQHVSWATNHFSTSMISDAYIALALTLSGLVASVAFWSVAVWPRGRILKKG